MAPPSRSIATLVARQFHPLSSRLSPLRWISDWRVERYYRRLLRDDATPQRWAAHYLRGLDLPAGAAVLDHGCGRGRHAAILSRLGFDVSAQDVAAHRWWSELPRTRFQVVPPDAPRLPWPGGAFAAMFDFEVLHYVGADGLDRLCAEAFRVLRPGGYWILLEANDEGVGAALPRRQIGRLHSLDRVRAAVGRAGFTEVDVDYEGFYAPVLPLFVNLLRKQLWPRRYDVADFDSALAAALPPRWRARWRLRLQRPLGPG